MFRKILIGVAAVVVAFAVLVALQPSDFRISRKATIAAPPAAVFAVVNDFHRWNEWSPWAKLDPAMKQNIEGSPAGKGAIYTWSGNAEAGAGRMTIEESQPNEKIGMLLEFTKPFAATDQTEFVFKPVGDQTEVTWSMTGSQNFMLKAVTLFMNMDKMVGGDFERGLANLKRLVEPKAMP